MSSAGAATIEVFGGTTRDVEFERRLLSRFERSRRRERLERALLGAGVPFCGFLIWQLLSVSHALNSTFFPAPTSIVVDVVNQVRSRSDFDTIAASLSLTMRDTVIGFAIGAAAGVIVGIAMGTSRGAQFGLAPLIFGTFPTPKLAVYPLCLVLFGLGSGSAIALAAFDCFYLVCISTLSGVQFSSSAYHEIAQVFDIPRWKRYRRIVLPAAAPSIISGLRLGLSDSLVIVLAVEFIGSATGMGGYIWNSWQQLAVGQMFTGLLLVMAIGGLLVLFGNVLERLAVPWSKD